MNIEYHEVDYSALLTLEQAAQESGVLCLTNKNYQAFWCGPAEHQLHVRPDGLVVRRELIRWCKEIKAEGAEAIELPREISDAERQMRLRYLM